MGMFADPPEGVAPRRLADMVERCLETPIGARSFKDRDLSGQEIVIVVGNSVSNAPVPTLFRSVLRTLLEAGASPSRVRILLPGRRDRAFTTQEVARRIGWAGALPFAWRETRGWDQGTLVILGRTHRQSMVYLDQWMDGPDLTIVLDAIQPDPILGYTGGLQSVIQCCSGDETVEGVFSQSYSSACALPGVIGEANATRSDLEEASRMSPTELFIVNAVADTHGRWIGAVAGSPDRAFAEGAGICRAHAEVLTDRLAQVVLVSAQPGGRTLMDGVRAVLNVSNSVRDGGAVLLLDRGELGMTGFPTPETALPPKLLRVALKTFGQARLRGTIERVYPHTPAAERATLFQLYSLIRRARVLVYSPGVSAIDARSLRPMEWHPDTPQLIERARKLHASALMHAFPYGGSCFATKGP
jgi:nickel-dependent lactate racemase